MIKEFHEHLLKKIKSGEKSIIELEKAGVSTVGFEMRVATLKEISYLLDYYTEIENGKTKKGQ